MPIGKVSTIAFAAVLSAGVMAGVVRAAPPAASPANQSISCEAPLFAPNSSHARLTDFFGAANVEIRREPPAEGEKPRVSSIIYPKDPKMRLEVEWFYDKTLEGITSISIAEPSRWVGPKGMRTGMNLVEVERAHKEPYSMLVAEGETDDSKPVFIGVYMFKDQQPGLCRMSLLMKPGKKLTERQKDEITGHYDSISQPLRAARMRVISVEITYNR